MQLRDYQKEISNQGLRILKELQIVYLAMQVRTGKTLTSLEIAQLYDAKDVLFITKKKAIGSIKKDYLALNPGYQLTIINYESLHKVEGDFDLLIVDEAHRLGAYPKPCKAALEIRKRFSKLPMIFLSGTPSPESYSQLFHQFFISANSPFKGYSSFYKWAKDYVNITQKVIGSLRVNDYSDAKWELIEKVLKPYMISYTQEEAGFQVELKEHFIYVEMEPKIYTLAHRLIQDRAIQGSSGIISASNPAVLQQKVHQIHSGTVILDPESEDVPGKKIVLSRRKAEAILENFPGKKLAIFYQFDAEKTLLKEVLGDSLTFDLEEFDATDKSIALQFVSGREGINLSKADLIVAYNISFSATTYFQFRDRLTTIDRLTSDIYWIFAKDGIESKIYQAVVNKQNYTLSHFNRDFQNVRERRTETLCEAS